MRTAWVDEDAFITFRTIDNFFEGYGLRWNVAERVQTYSHPLWMMLLSMGRWISGEYYFSAMTLGVLCTAGALYGVGYRVSTSLSGAACGLFVLAFSKSFVSFSTSGLEAPLTHLLIAIFAALYFSDREAKQRLFGLTLVASLAAVNRPDTILLFAPALCFACRGLTPLSVAKTALLGSLPLLMWIAFATLYYGTPIPVTGYAKAMSGIPQDAMFAQGVQYYKEVATRDPILLPALSIGILAALFWRSLRGVGLAIGALLYCLYLLKIGGGYMSGRFLTPPLFVAAILISRIVFAHGRRWVQPAFLVGAVVLGLSARNAPLLSGSDFSTKGEGIPTSGITDECGTWYQRTGLWSKYRSVPEPASANQVLGLDLDPDNPRIFLDVFVGIDGFLVGPGLHIVDPILCDPLLMRLPIWDAEDWRVGHYLRRVPDGYLESVAFGKNLIRDPGLARAYDDVRIITRGRLLDPKRLRAIWSLAFGDGKQGLEQYRANGYRALVTKTVQLGDLSTTCEDGSTIWNEAYKFVGKGGLQVLLPGPSNSSQLTLGLGGKAEYSIGFMRDGRKLAEVVPFVAKKGKLFPGIQATVIEVPEAASSEGFDTILIEAKGFRRSGIHCVAFMEQP